MPAKLLNIIGNFSLKRKLSLLAMGTCGIAVFLLYLLFLMYVFYNSKYILKNEIALISDIMGERNLGALLFDDDEAIEKSLTVLNVKPSIQLACIYGKNGRVKATYLNPDTHLFCPLHPELGYKFEWDFVSSHQYIKKDDVIIGSFYIQSDMREAKAVLIKSLIYVSLTVVTILLFSFLLARQIGSFISRPIGELQRMTQLVRVGQYNLKVKKYYNDEVGALTKAFNDMANQINERDIKLKSYNERLEEALQKAKTVDVAKSEFISNMSHEFRTPLHGIGSFSSYALQDLSQGKVHEIPEYIRRIQKSQQRLLSFVQDILNTADLEQGKKEFIFEKGDIYEVMHGVWKEMEASLKEKQLSLTLLRPSCSTNVCFDHQRMIQVFTNLIGNALKFTPEGKEIRVSFEHIKKAKEKKDSRPTLAISVIDQGPGIPDDELELIFVKFTQSSVTSSGDGGTGLGLCIAQDIMRAHEGSIVASNNENNIGTRFTAFLPKDIKTGIRKVKIY